MALAANLKRRAASKPSSTTPGGNRSDAADIFIGKRIRLLRESRGMTMEEVAAQLGVAWQQLQKYENGKNRVPSGRLAAVAKALRCEVSEFFPPDDSVPVAERDLARHADNHETLRIMRAYGAIANATARTAVLALVELLARSS